MSESDKNISDDGEDDHLGSVVMRSDLVICDDVRVEASGRYSLMGVYREPIYLPRDTKFPVTIPGIAYAGFVDVDEIELNGKDFGIACVYHPHESDPIPQGGTTVEKTPYSDIEEARSSLGEGETVMSRTEFSTRHIAHRIPGVGRFVIIAGVKGEKRTTIIGVLDVQLSEE